MRPSEDLTDPEIRSELEAIDATLRGEAVDPAFAEIAEVALLLTAERPVPSVEFVTSLDASAARLFVPKVRRAPASAPEPTPITRLHRTIAGLFSRPAFAGLLVGAVAAIVVTVVLVTGAAGGLGGSSSFAGTATSIVYGGSAAPPKHGSATSGSAGSSDAGSSSAGVATTPSSAVPAPGLPARARATATTPSPDATDGAASTAGTSKSLGSAKAKNYASALPTVNTAGRKVVQSVQIQLGAASDRINAVSQELIDVMSQEHGIVERSQVNSGTGTAGYATFTLSIPSANLESSMGRLSSLRYANVVSRREASSDVTDTYRDDKRDLADARGLRTKLLQQLELADTTADIDSLKAQIQNAERQIAADESRINKLQHRVSYTTVRVEINAQNVGVAPVVHTHRFTIRRAAHDAVRVLVVVGGVLLIALSVLIPLTLIVGLIAWISYLLRRRRRERVLDEQ